MTEESGGASGAGVPNAEPARTGRAPKGFTPWLRSLGLTVSRVVAALGFLIAVALPAWIAAGPGIGPKYKPHDRFFGYAAAFAAVYTLSVLIWAVHKLAIRTLRKAAAQAGTPVPGDPPGLLVGADNRLSTSKLSAAAWTWLIGWAILALVAARWAGDGSGWEKLLSQGIEDQYLILLGGPFLALVSAKAFLSSALKSGKVTKTVETDPSATGTANRISQAYSNDSGQTDLVDTQYLLFGAVVILVFVGTFLRGPLRQGLPALPDFLIALASVGTTVYIANKWQAADAAPAIMRVAPDRQDRSAARDVTIYGTNLLSVSHGGQPHQYKDDDEITVIFEGVDVVRCIYGVLKGRISPPGSSADWIIVVPPVPADTAPWSGNELKANVTFVNVLGVASNSMPFTYVRA